MLMPNSKLRLGFIWVPSAFFHQKFYEVEKCPPFSKPLHTCTCVKVVKQGTFCRTWESHHHSPFAQRSFAKVGQTPLLHVIVPVFYIRKPNVSMAHGIIILNDDLTIYSQGSSHSGLCSRNVYGHSLLADSMQVWALKSDPWSGLSCQRRRLLLDCGSMIYLLPLKYTKKGTNNLMKVSVCFFCLYYCCYLHFDDKL